MAKILSRSFLVDNPSKMADGGERLEKAQTAAKDLGLKRRQTIWGPTGDQGSGDLPAAKDLETNRQ